MFKTCRVCGEPFNIPPSRYNKRFTCSTKCSKKERKGKKLTQNHKINISKGLKSSLKHNAGQFIKGFKPWNKRLKYDDKMKAKLDLSGLLMNGERKGIKHSIETKKKISQSKKENPIRFWLNKKRPKVSGKNHWNWKNGITSKDKLERARFRIKLQKAIFERDNYTCQNCGKRAGMLQVHHIKSWAKNPELRFNKNNCQTLCAFCHYKKTFGVEMPRDVRTWGQNLTQIGA